MGCDLVSVIIPTYNRNDLMKKAIVSVLNQTYENIEVIVVDDAHNKETKKIVETFNDSRLKYLKNSGTGGNAARNHGINTCKGEYVSFLDDDDQYHNNKIEKQMKFLNKKKSDMVFCLLNMIYTNGKTNKWKPPFCKKKNIYKYLLVYNFIQTSAVLCKKSVLESVCKFDEKMKKFQDWDLFLRIVQKQFQIDCLEEHLIDFFVHDDKRVSSIEIDNYHEIYAKHKKAAKDPIIFFLLLLHCLKINKYTHLKSYIKTVWIE